MRTIKSIVAIVALSLAACAPEVGDGPQDRASATLHSSSTAVNASAPVDSNLALSDNGGGCFAPLISANPTQLLSLIPTVNPEWAPVVNGSNPVSEPVLIHGTAVESHISHEDFPAGHVTFDQNTELVLDPADLGRLATGNTDGRLEIEWETGSYPAWAWAGIGDRVVALGRWIFDCGHPDPLAIGLCEGAPIPCISNADCPATPPGVPAVQCQGARLGYRSELHPPQAIAVIRSGRGGVLHPSEGGEGHAVPVTRADVFISPDGGGAGDECIVSHKPSPEAVIFGVPGELPCFPLKPEKRLAQLNAKDFTFDVPLPDVPRGREPELRVSPQQPAPAVAAAYEARFVAAPQPHFEVTVRMTQPVDGHLPTGFASTFLAGWRHAPRSPLAHLRVTVDTVVVQNALKPPLPLPDLVVPPGWKMQVNVNGEWQEIAGLGGVATPGPVAVNAVFDQFLPRDATLRIHSDASSKMCFDPLFAHSLLEDLVLFGFNPFDPDPTLPTLGLAIAKGTLCLKGGRPDGLDKELDAGEVDVAFTGPTFGASAEPYEVASAGENGPAYKLRFRIVRVDDDDDAETAVSAR